MTSPDPSLADLAPFAGTWTLDPARTSILFHTKAMWILKVKGTIQALEGGGTVGDDGGLSGTLVLDAASVDTGNKKRDAHLRTADFFEVDTHPTMTFTAADARPNPAGRVEVTGTLTIHGQSRPITVEADVQVAGGSATVSAEVDIDRAAWGLTWSKMGAGLANRVVINAVFTKA
jgi:polyisoprenoid-binding protein YceI